MKLFTVILVLVLCSSSSFAQNIFNVKASATGGATSWTLLGFYPSALTVGQGDTVQFSVDGETVAVAFAPSQPPVFSDGVNFVYNTILAPQTSPVAVSSTTETFSSGILAVGSTFNFTMTTVGTYNVFDVLHPLSTSYTITVVNGNAPASPASVDSQVDQLLTVARAGVQSTITSNPAITVTAPTSIANPDAGSTAKYWQVYLGFGSPALLASLSGVLPQNFSVAPGDVVQFVNKDVQSHMIAFDPSGTFSGCSNAYPAPATSYYAKTGDSNAFSGASFISSGVLLPNQIFTVRFTTTGTFAYLDCAAGSRGYVSVVTPPTTTPAPTKKKDKPIPAGRAIGQVLVILLILLIISAIGIFLIVLIDLDCRQIFHCCCDPKPEKLKTAV